MTHATFLELAQRYSVGYISEISQEDVSLARELSKAHFEFPDMAMPRNGDVDTLLGVLKFKVDTFPTQEQQEPIVINSLLLLVLVTEDRHLKKVTMRYLRDANIPSIKTLLDDLENDLRPHTTTIDLNGQWSLCDAESAMTIEAVVPGTFLLRD